MNFRLIYTVGTILLFIGLFTIMLPEITHHYKDEYILDKDQIIFPSTIYGFLITITGLFCIEYTTKRQKNARTKR